MLNQKNLVFTLLFIVIVKFVFVPLNDSLAQSKENMATQSHAHAKTLALTSTAKDIIKNAQQIQVTKNEIITLLQVLPNQEIAKLDFQSQVEDLLIKHNIKMKRFYTSVNNTENGPVSSLRARVTFTGNTYDILQFHASVLELAPKLRIFSVILNGIDKANSFGVSGTLVVDMFYLNGGING